MILSAGESSIMPKTVIPAGYRPALGLYDTQKAIGLIKQIFLEKLCGALHLKRVTAPLFVDPATGLNDDLNGVERPVTFDVPALGANAEVVHSLAKWKRMALAQYDFHVGNGLVTDMNAIRRDEEMDNLHSIYVDQWDWEKVITREERTIEYLKQTVQKIVDAVCGTLDELKWQFPALERVRLCRETAFATAQELEDQWPALTPKERENAFAKAHGTVFIIGIGGALRSGRPHDGRAPDYDDWALNGDIFVYYPLLDIALELSSMGIRVDEQSLVEQLDKAGCPQRANLAFQKAIIEKKLPYTIGGGIGQSRICMFFLRKAHIGEVQSSIWRDDTIQAAVDAGVRLL